MTIHEVHVEMPEKSIYYVLDKKGNVLDFTEKKTEHVYGNVPEDLTLEEFKKIIDWDSRFFVFKDNTLSSKPKHTETELLKKEFEKFKKDTNGQIDQLLLRVATLEKNGSASHEVDIEIEE